MKGGRFLFLLIGVLFETFYIKPLEFVVFGFCDAAFFEIHF
jgi:hypothetical protein